MKSSLLEWFAVRLEFFLGPEVVRWVLVKCYSMMYEFSLQIWKFTFYRCYNLIMWRYINLWPIVLLYLLTGEAWRYGVPLVDRKEIFKAFSINSRFPFRLQFSFIEGNFTLYSQDQRFFNFPFNSCSIVDGLFHILELVMSSSYILCPLKSVMFN
jgi:hypothetical protein